jgi:hypothetical protein
LTVEVIICSSRHIINMCIHCEVGFTSIQPGARIWSGFLALLFVNSAALQAQEPDDRIPRTSEKAVYTLFHPTPRQSMREMSTDRPDQTESPYTVDAGHFQLEMDLVSAVLNRERAGGGDVTTEIWNVAPINLKMGLLNNVDLQLILDTYVHSRVEEDSIRRVTQVSGFGDITTRLKINFSGNDRGKTAFAFMPFVKWPLPKSGLRNGKTEGGLIFPMAVDLAKGWDMGAMTEFDFVADDAGGYDTEFINSLTVGHNLTDNLRMYLEFFTVTGSAPGFRWQGQVDVGWTYALRENVQLDCGCNFGVTRSAADFGPFAGLSFRF